MRRAFAPAVHPIPDNRRQRAAQRRRERGKVSLRIIAARSIEIVAQHKVTRQRIIPLIRKRQGVRHDQHMRRAVVIKLVVEHVDILIGHHDDPRARRHARHDIAGGRKVARVVAGDFIVEDAGGVTAGYRKIRQIEHQDTAGVVAGDVAIDIGVHRVFDLDAGNIIFDHGVADDDIVRLADIDARIRRGADGDILHQHIFRFDRIDTIGAIVLVRPAGPFHRQIPVNDLIGALGFDPVTPGVAHTEIHQGHII